MRLLAVIAAALFLAMPAAAAPVPLPAAPGCPLFPETNVWNRPVGKLPLRSNSRKVVRAIGARLPVHTDFGSGLWEGAPIGIPITVVDSSQATSPVDFAYDDESDAGPYPIPNGVAIEGGDDSDGDRHAIIVDSDSCTLYELFALYPSPWSAGSGAIWSLTSNALRPRGWTSADAAGLPATTSESRRGSSVKTRKSGELFPVYLRSTPVRDRAGALLGVVTTVEDIATAVEISPSTFFNYFPSKEAVVFEDDLDPFILGAFDELPATMNPIARLREAMKTVFARITAEQDVLMRQRVRLMAQTPPLRSAMLGQFAELADQIAVLDHGKVVAAGTPDELKRSIPGAHVRLRFAGTTGIEAAQRALGGAFRHDDPLTLEVPSDGGATAVRELLNRLGDTAADVGEVSVHTPDLDDVFFALTGHPTAETTPEMENAR